MTVALTLLLMLALLLIKGFFSGSEIAFVSADRVKLRNRAAQGQGGARLAQRLLQDPARLLTTTLLGTNMSSIALTTVGTLLMVELFGGEGELIALVVFAPLFLILGEIVPKSVYQQKADGIVPVIAYPLGWLQVALAPLVWVFSLAAKLAARLIGGAADETSATRDQFLAAVRMAEKAGEVEAFSRGQVRNVLRFAQMTAGEAMWPLSEVPRLSRDCAMADLVELRRRTGNRLVPLYEASPETITSVAVLESWDLLDPEIGTRVPADFLGPVRFAPPQQAVSEVIEMLHGEPRLTVIVVDEFGNGLGLLTLNLLVRGTLGAQTSPLTDRDKVVDGPRLERQDGGGFRLDGLLPISQVNEQLDISLPTTGQSTIGGYALSAFGRLPLAGESFAAQGYRFTVSAADERRILSLTADRA